jgi:hypothetical protein
VEADEIAKRRRQRMIRIAISQAAFDAIDVILRLVASSGSGMEGACASYSLQLAHIAMTLAARQSVTVERPRSSSI